MGTGDFFRPCDRCRVKLDTFNPTNVSLGMTGALCPRCGKITKRDQKEKIRKFQKKCKKRGLVPRITVDGAGHATMRAFKPKKESEDGRKARRRSPQDPR